LVELQVSVALFPSTIEAGATAMLAVGAGAVTVTLTALDVDALLDELPLYAAVTESVPAASDVVVKVAMPVPFKLTVPSVAPPLLKVTVPAGTNVPVVSVTVAVNVTAVPVTAEVGEALKVVLVGAVRMILATNPSVPPPP
jgi:hypothetical protein